MDVDDTLKQTYGYAKQGAGRGYTGVKGLNALLATISTPSSAPVIAAARLPKGSANSGKGSAKLVGEALGTARKAGASGLLILRADSAYYRRDVIEMALRQRACFSITARLLIPVRKAIDAIPADACTPIKYTHAIYDEQSQSWVSNAEVAEISYTAFASKAKAQRVTARLIVRRVPDLNPSNQASCSPPTGITPCSPTARCRCSKRTRRTGSRPARCPRPAPMPRSPPKVESTLTSRSTVDTG